MTNPLHRSGSRDDNEAGVVIVLVALLLVAMMTIVALVVDIAVLRSDRRTNKSTADFAVTAGVIDLTDGPWAGVCTAWDYLLEQSSEFGGGFASVTYESGNGPLPDNPCESAPVAECNESDASTWAILTATSVDGTIKVEISSPYDPSTDAVFANEETFHTGDEGTPCEQLAVRIFETKSPAFAGVIGVGDHTTAMRAVARRAPGTPQRPAALILLERRDCNVIQTGGSNTRVVAKANEDRPGIIQIDSAGTGACQSQPIINGQSTSGGPSIMACSTLQVLYSCNNPTPGVNEASIVGVYAALVNTGANIARPYGDNRYGDTPYRSAGQFTRGPVDTRYRSYVAALDARLNTTFLGSNSALPPGCGALAPDNTCTAAGETWLVISGTNCSPATATTLAAVAQNVWFNCVTQGQTTYKVEAPLLLPQARKVVFNGGDLLLNSSLHAPIAQEVFVRGTSSGGNPIGLEVGNGGHFALNTGGALDECPADPPFANVLAVRNGSYSAGSGGAVLTCFTFTYLASGGDKVPTEDGTAPCPSPDNATPCAGYNGPLKIGSGATVEWSAPNLLHIPFCLEGMTDPCYDQTEADANPFEDLALWVESAQESVITGGGTTSMSGVFFLPNANGFKLAGGGSLPIELNAQFIVRKLEVTGGATVSLSPDPNDSLTISAPNLGLVR